MKAVLCKAYGPPSSLSVEELPALHAGAGEIVISVRAAGVNFPDSLIIEGKYQLKPPPPFSPGAEVAGVVKEVGAGVTSVRVGARVVALMPFGGFAEEVTVGEPQVLPIPDALDFETAGGLLMAYGTSHYALSDRAGLKAGETLLVLGAAGGLGLSAVELGKLAGARVIAVASSDEKLAVCKEHGADALINYARDDLRARLKQEAPAGIDVVYDVVGGPHAETALRAMAWNGRYLVIGFAAGEIPKVPLNLPLLKGCSIVGVFWGSYLMRSPEAARAMHLELLEWAASKKIRPRVSGRFPLERAVDALNEITSRKVTGKVVLIPDMH